MKKRFILFLCLRASVSYLNFLSSVRNHVEKLNPSWCVFIQNLAGRQNPDLAIILSSFDVQIDQVILCMGDDGLDTENDLVVQDIRETIHSIRKFYNSDDFPVFVAEVISATDVWSAKMLNAQLRLEFPFIPFNISRLKKLIVHENQYLLTKNNRINLPAMNIIFSLKT